MRSIKTQRLELEPLQEKHARQMFEVLSDVVLYQHIDEKPPVSIEWLAQRYRKLESQKSPDGTEHWLNWVIRTETKEVVGFVQATVYQDHSANIAFMLGSTFWGRGFANESTVAVLDELVQSYSVNRYFATVAVENSKSLSLLRRLGFSEANSSVYHHGTIKSGDVLMMREIKV